MIMIIILYVSDCLYFVQTACERIINTPMPLPYLIQIRQLVFIYVLSLPFIMVGLFGNWASLAGSFLLSFGLLGIEEAGKYVALKSKIPCSTGYV